MENDRLARSALEDLCKSEFFQLAFENNLRLALSLVKNPVPVAYWEQVIVQGVFRQITNRGKSYFEARKGDFDLPDSYRLHRHIEFVYMQVSFKSGEIKGKFVPVSEIYSWLSGK